MIMILLSSSTSILSCRVIIAIAFFLFPFIYSSSAPPYNNNNNNNNNIIPSIRKDASLQGLISLLNSHADFFAEYDYSVAHYQRFMNIILPWIVAIPSETLKSEVNEKYVHKDYRNYSDYRDYRGVKENTTSTSNIVSNNDSNNDSKDSRSSNDHQNLRSNSHMNDIGTINQVNQLAVNCQSKRYHRVLTGEVLSSPRVLVDIIPFGYDIDLLHVRLHELYHAVDVFIIFESSRTFTGIPKPFYYSLIKDTPRFQRYQDKILHLTATDQQMPELIRQVQHADSIKFSSGGWALDIGKAKQIIDLFKAIPAHTSSLKKLIMKNIHNVWAFQNDGDEIIMGEAAWHLKHCAMKPHIEAIYFPCFSLKMNFHWLQKTYDMIQFEDDSFPQNVTAELSHYLWKGGPYAWPFGRMLASESTMRHHSVPLHPITEHMGLGAAVHMSSISEPASYWLKKGSVVEEGLLVNSQRSTAIQRAVVRAGKQSKISADIITRECMLPFCLRGNHILMHVDNLSPESKELVMRTIPLAVRQNANSFPFLLPGMVSGPIAPGVAIAGKKEWVHLCSGKVEA